MLTDEVSSGDVREASGGEDLDGMVVGMLLTPDLPPSLIVQPPTTQPSNRYPNHQPLASAQSNSSNFTHKQALQSIGIRDPSSVCQLGLKLEHRTVKL